MRNALMTVAAVSLMGLTSCTGGEDASMPDVTNQRLDVALSDIDRAGFSKDDVDIVGGGTFGVIDESNWQVCQQDPAAGDPIGGSPRLVVDRECDSAPEPDSGSDNSEDDATDGATESPADAGNTGADVRRDRPRRKSHAVETFTMPAVVGSNLQDAQDLLQSLGSYVLTQTDASGMGRFQIWDRDWKVCYQRPAAGSVVPLSKLVDLGAVKLDERCP